MKAYEAQIIITVASNAENESDFKHEIELATQLAVNTFQRNNLMVADRDGKEPKIKILKSLKQRFGL